MFINNFIRTNKENGEEIRKFKEEIKQHCSSESELLEILNRIYNANLSKKRKKKLWIYILILPSSRERIILPPKIINQIEEDSIEQLGKKGYIKYIRWPICEAKHDNNVIENGEIKNP